MMRLKRSALAICAFFAFFASGCSKMGSFIYEDDFVTIHFRGSATENYDQSLKYRSGSSSEEAITLDLNYVLNACTPVMSKFERSAKRRARTAFGIAVTGLVAGSITVPALTAVSAASNAAWIGALGGLAGATNTAQQVLSAQGLTSVEALTTRAEIRKEFNAALNEYTSANSDEKRKIALEKAYASCMVYAVHVPNIKVSKIPVSEAPAAEDPSSSETE